MVGRREGPVGKEGPMDDTTPTPEWERYGRAVIGSMLEVLEEAREEHHPLLLEA